MRASRRNRVSHFGIAAVAVCVVLAGAGFVLAQESDQQLRCMQLQQELASAQGGGASTTPARHGGRSADWRTEARIASVHKRSTHSATGSTLATQNAIVPQHVQRVW